MRRVCSVCKMIFGCKDEGGARKCNACETHCSFYQQTESADTEPVLHGLCDTCFGEKFVVQRPGCKG